MATTLQLFGASGAGVPNEGTVHESGVDCPAAFRGARCPQVCQRVVLCAVFAALSLLLLCISFCSVCEARGHVDLGMLVVILVCFFASQGAGTLGWVTSVGDTIVTTMVIDTASFVRGHQASPQGPTESRAPPSNQHACADSCGGQGGHFGGTGRGQKSNLHVVSPAQTDRLTPEASEASKAMERCVWLGDACAALRLFDQMLAKGVAPGACFIDRLISSKFFKLVSDNLNAERVREDGLRLLGLIQSHGLSPSISVQNRVVVAWKSNLPVWVLAYFLKMRGTGVVISHMAYNCMLELCGKTHPELALEIYDEMEALGLKFDTVTYNSMLDVCFKLRMHDEAQLRFGQMADRALVPNKKSYLIMLKVYIARRQYCEAIAVFDQMRELFLEPNRHDYHHAIWSCISLQRIERAVELYNEMASAKLAPRNATRVLLIAACRNYGYNPRLVPHKF